MGQGNYTNFLLNKANEASAPPPLPQPKRRRSITRKGVASKPRGRGQPRSDEHVPRRRTPSPIRPVAEASVPRGRSRAKTTEPIRRRGTRSPNRDVPSPAEI